MTMKIKINISCHWKNAPHNSAPNEARTFLRTFQMMRMERDKHVNEVEGNVKTGHLNKIRAKGRINNNYFLLHQIIFAVKKLSLLVGIELKNGKKSKCGCNGTIFG